MVKKKKETVIIIGLIVIAVIFGIAYTLLSKHNEKKEAEGDKKISLMQVDSSLIEKLEIKNESGELVFIKENDIWVLEDDKDFSVNQDMVQEILDYYSNIEYLQNVGEDNSEKADFGLDKPQAVGTATLSDNTKVVVSLGDTVANYGGFYGTVDGMDGIYVFEAGKFYNLTYDKASFKQEETESSEAPVATEEVADSTESPESTEASESAE